MTSDGANGMLWQKAVYANLQGPLCTTCALIKGSVAGTTAKFCVYPLDRLKMIYQAKVTKVGPFHLRHLFSEFASVYRDEGLLSLWKGYAAGFARTFVHSGIVYCCFDFYQKFLVETMGNPFLGNALAGGCAGLTGTIISYPLDVCNTRMAVTRYALKYREVTLVHYEGLRSLYRGSLTTCLGIFPYAGCSFCTFEFLKSQMREWDGNYQLSSLQYLVCGGMAGVVSQTVTYPLDTVRKFLQVNTFLFKIKEEGYTGKTHPSIKMAIQHIYRASGVRGFYNGVSLNWFKGFLGAGISFMVHEQIKWGIQKFCDKEV